MRSRVAKVPQEKEPQDDIRRRIAEAAYYRAQKRGFAPGFEEEDWREAEREVRGARPAPRPGREP